MRGSALADVENDDFYIFLHSLFQQERSAGRSWIVTKGRYMRCSGLADVENDDLNAAKCDVLGLRMLKLMCVFYSLVYTLVNMPGFIFSALADVENDDFYRLFRFVWLSFPPPHR